MAGPFDVSVVTNAELRLADGVTLRSDVYTPDADGPFPVVICRTPYDKLAARNVEFARTIAARGYIAVVQDVRGTHASDGDFVWHYLAASVDVEAADGYACVEWAAKLPKSDGRVGTFGVSYAAWTSWVLLKSRPPSLAAMQASNITASNRHMNFGITETGRRLQWTYAMGASLRGRAGDTRWPSTVADGEADWMTRLRDKWTWRLPLSSIPDRVFGQLASDQHVYMGEQEKELWGFDRFYGNADLPIFVQTGWWDRFSLSVSHYEGLRNDGPPAFAARHRLVVGPWPHFPLNYRSDIGPVDYGPDAAASYPDMVADWYDFEFKGRENETASGARVRLFILNEGWRGFETWPPPGLQEVSWYLSSGGSANTPGGDGALVAEAPADEIPDTYSYDPADPVMSLMGSDSQYLPVDQKANAHRDDILVYRSEPLERDMVLAGPLKIELWAASDRRDTDFCVRLIEERAEGIAINISGGIMRARYRNGYDTPKLLEPGVPERFDIVMLPVGIRFQAGSRLRIDVTSSDFPAYDRNHNTGGDDWNESTLLVAQQTVFHDAARPSRLVLPVLPG